MTTALSTPSALYGAFSENGYRLQARIPASRGEERMFLLTVAAEASEQVLLSLRVPMLYAPVFGVDVGDAATLEAVTDAVLTALPSGGQATADDIHRAAQAALAHGATRA